MLRLTKKVLLPMAALGLAVATGTMVVQRVSAQENDSKYPPVVQALVDKFNLDQSQVDAVLEEQRVAHQEQMHQRAQERIDAAVAAGTLTSDQAQLLADKMAQNQANREGMQGLSREEKRAEARSHHEEMEAWAQENGIDLEAVMPAGPQFNGAEGMGRHMGDRGYHLDDVE